MAMDRCAPDGEGKAVEATERLQRDTRIDVLRGLALLLIFVDHIPGNVLGLFTLRNFGFSDAAELFVLLSGFSSMIAYGRVFERAGGLAGLRRILFRCLRIYMFQIGMLLAMVAIVQVGISWFGWHAGEIGPLMHGMSGFRRGLSLQAVPSNLNILPLYLVLMGAFPVFWLGLRRWPMRALLVSCGVWVAANEIPGFNLVNWLDGQGWYFNPFAWQFLFVIAMLLCSHYLAQGQRLAVPRLLWLACLLYVGFALFAAAPWANWGLAWKPLALDPDKTTLAPLRLLNVLALFVLLMNISGFAGVAGSRWLRPLDLCGRHSLEVFSLGTMLSLFGHLVFHTFGTSALLQIAVNGGGFAAMIALAAVLEWRKRTGRSKLPPGGLMEAAGR